MKLAFVYDRINKMGGAERVLMALHELWPHAPLYTALYHREKAPWARGWDIRPSLLNRVPCIRDKHEYLAPFMPYVFEAFDFSDYDVVISITSAEAKGIITQPHTLHLSYLLTPTRYLWSHTHEYAGKSFSKVIKMPFLSSLRRWDYIAAQRPDYLVPISQVVSQRITKYYHREPLPVLYPPVDTEFFAAHPTTCVTPWRNYFLIVGRQVAYKKTHAVIEAFRHLPKLSLVIVGCGRDRPITDIPENVHYVGAVSDEALSCYYHHAQALLYPQEEDFGITALEAQAAGKPVGALKKGGATETIIDGETGCFFENASEENLIKTIRALNGKHWYDTRIRAHAGIFAKKRFQQLFTATLEGLWEKHHRSK